MQNRGTNETPTKSSSHHPLSSSLPLSSSSSLPRTPTTPAAPTFLRSSQTVLTAGGTPVRINSQPHLRSQQQQQQQQQLGVQATIRGIAVYEGSLTPRKALQTSQVTSTTAPATSSRPGIDISSSVRLPTARRDLFSPAAHKMDSSNRGSSRLARHSEAALRTSSAASTSHPTSSTPRRQTTTAGSSASSPPPSMPGTSGLPKPLGVAAKSRRSEVHAQEVDQLRAQSRAGFSSRGPAVLNDEDDDSDADIDDHRRVLSPRHGRNARRGTSPFSGPSARLSSSGHDTSETEATQRPLNRRRSQAAAATSPRYSTLAHLPSASSRRQPLPDEFFPPSSSSPRTRQESEETILNRPSETGDAADQRASSSRAPRRRRYASDAHADEIPSFQYEGRGGTGAARLSVDASSVKRHLAAAARARTTSGPQAAAAAAATSATNTLSPRLAMREFAESSSPVPRTRGMPVASPSIARPSSRMSAVGAATTDLFDDNSMRSPTLRARPDLPPEALERVRALRIRQEALQAVPLSSRKDGGTSSGASAGIDDVRARIEDIDIRGSAIASSSRSSSVISSAPRPRAHTAQLDRQRLLAEQSRGPAPLSEPRRLADARRVGTGGSEEPYRANGHATMHETLRRHASHAAFPSTPDALPHQRPASRFSTLSRGVTPGPVLKSTSSAAARGGATTAHERNLLVAFDLFERNFGGPSGSDNANHTSPTAARLYGPESGELVEKARGFLDTVTTLNAGLRDVAQYVIQREIDAEVDASLDVPPASSASASSSSRAANPVSTLALLKELDQAVGSLVKYSDNQVRNLGELLAAFTRADRERTRARTAMGGAEYDRSDSRMSHTGTPTNCSPTRHGSARRGNTLGSAAANLSTDAGSDRSLRRAGSLAPSSGLRRETRDIRQAATTASSSAAGSDSGSIDRRSSIWRSGDRSSAVGGGGGSIAGNGIIAPDDPRTSPTMSVSSSRPRTTMGAFAANHHHGRSYSELSLGPLAPERSPSATRQRLAFLTQRREQREQGVATLGRSSTSGAPRRPKLSDPSLATAIAVSSKTHAMSDRPIVYDDAAGALGHAYHDDGEGLEAEDADDYFDDAGPSRDSSTADGRGGETPRLGMRTSRDEMPPPPAFSRQHRAAAHLSRRTISPIATTAAQQQQLNDEEPYERIRSATEGPSNASTSDASFASQPPLPSPTRPLRNPRRSMVLSRSGSGSGTFSEVQSGDRSGGAGLASSSFDVILDGYHSTSNGTAPDQQQQRPQSVAGYSSLASRHAPASAQMPQQSKGPSAWRHPNGLEGVRGSSLLPHSAGSASPTSSSSAGAAAMAHTLSARTSLRQSLAAAADQEGRGPAGRGA